MNLFYQKKSKMNLKKLLLINMLFLPFVTFANEAKNVAAENEATDMLELVVILFAIAVVLFMVISLTKMWKMVMKQELIRSYAEQGIPLPESASSEGGIWSMLQKAFASTTVPVEREKDILMDHDYDGIKELDNTLPPWWLYMFYITIVWAVVYLGYFHVYGGALQEEEYLAEMEIANEAKAAFLKRQANKIDENNVAFLTGAADLEIGKTIYTTNCVACHGANGEGGIGPNFADEYWLHGGSPSDIFKTIKYGVPEKGMISWKDQMSLSDIQKVASFIHSFQGTNHANGKEPQGEIYKPE